MEIQKFIAQCAARFESTLVHYLAGTARAEILQQALEYSAFAPGKRIRPALVYATGQLLGASETLLDDAACAIELVHTYSLIHDDLPAMDDDELRRGRPTCHIQFDEATAILAGDALLTLAFEVLASGQETIRLQLIRTLAQAAGKDGMVGGQSLDLAATGHFQNLTALQQMHALKTGALLQASVELGAQCSLSATPETVSALKAFGYAAGVAFQIQDDVLDVEADTATLGKPAGSDEAQDKSTYPALLGLEGAKREAMVWYDRANSALIALNGDTSTLAGLADLIIMRKY